MNLLKFALKFNYCKMSRRNISKKVIIPEYDADQQSSKDPLSNLKILKSSAKMNEKGKVKPDWSPKNF